ncbi:MAG: hypothetical protein KUG67_03565 [Proteobacteria bacterium]|nr:hypothetical protein [Pseudomonadota bacterium]
MDTVTNNAFTDRRNSTPLAQANFNLVKEGVIKGHELRSEAFRALMSRAFGSFTQKTSTVAHNGCVAGC